MYVFLLYSLLESPRVVISICKKLDKKRKSYIHPEFMMCLIWRPTSRDKRKKTHLNKATSKQWQQTSKQSFKKQKIKLYIQTKMTWLLFAVASAYDGKATVLVSFFSFVVCVGMLVYKFVYCCCRSFLWRMIHICMRRLVDDDNIENISRPIHI